MFKVFKPRKTLHEGDSYKTKIQRACQMLEELIAFGFPIELVLADSLYGEASSFLETIEKHNLDWVVAIRNNHGVWMPEEEEVRASRWQKFTRTLSDGTTEERYLREIIYGRRGRNGISFKLKPYHSAESIAPFNRLARFIGR